MISYIMEILLQRFNNELTTKNQNMDKEGLNDLVFDYVMHLKCL